VLGRVIVKRSAQIVNERQCFVLVKDLSVVQVVYFVLFDAIPSFHLRCLNYR